MGTQAAPVAGDARRAANVERATPARDGGQRAATQVLTMRGASLLRLQRSVGNQVVASLLASPHIQRCGPVPCNCSAEERHANATEAVTQRATGTVAQRVLPADLRVKGKFKGAASDPHAIYFDYSASTIDGAEDAKLVALTGTAVSTINLKGFASEEGGSGAAVIDARIEAVAKRLKDLTPGTGAPAKTPDLVSSQGNLNYRAMRKVEVLVAGAPSTTPNCSGGADINCGPAPNPFTVGHTQANTLLSQALTALGSPTVEPAKTALTDLFKGPANAPAVITGLTAIKNHLPNMLPAIPLGDTVAGGHRCINTCEGDVLAYNQGTGPGARMTVGPQYMTSPDPVDQGLTLIHEGSHGTTGLATGDEAYRWQRLLPFLTLAQALNNADSYTQLVAQIHTPGAPAGKPPDTFAVGMTPPQTDAAGRSLAWLEQYLVQGRLEFRSLYSAAHRANNAGAWQVDDQWYRDNTMTDAAPQFGLTPPPAVPSAESKARIAGIYDRLAQLRFAVTGGAVKFELGPATTWEAGPGSKVTLNTAFFALSAPAQVDALLVKVVNAASFIEAGRQPQYIAVIRRMASRMGGP